MKTAINQIVTNRENWLYFDYEWKKFNSSYML